MPSPQLIYCASGNKRFAEIAISHGYLYGACMPNTVYFDPVFTDQDWRKFKAAPDDEQRQVLRGHYMRVLERYRPRLATVLDWEIESQLQDVLSWAEEAAQWVSEAVIIIPKVRRGINRLPLAIGGKSVRFGYPAAGGFSGIHLPLSEFRGYPVHCLGGSVSMQLNVCRQLNCLSADGNYIQTMARRHCRFYSPAINISNRSWPQLKDVIKDKSLNDAIYLAFELTCIAVPMAFHGESGIGILDAQVEFLRSRGFSLFDLQQKLF